MGTTALLTRAPGASGKYQIMPSNIGPWSQQYLGKGRPSSSSRRPQIQDQLARAVLQSYFNQYGARGAAAAWYSGNPNSQGNYKRFRSNEPSVGEYVDQVLGRMGKSRTAYEAAGAQAPAQQAQNTPLGLHRGPWGSRGRRPGIGLAKADGTSGVTSGMGLGAATGALRSGLRPLSPGPPRPPRGPLRRDSGRPWSRRRCPSWEPPYVWGGASQGERIARA